MALSGLNLLILNAGGHVESELAEPRKDGPDSLLLCSLRMFLFFSSTCQLMPTQAQRRLNEGIDLLLSVAFVGLLVL